jgi:hypothetical protein
MIAQTAVLEYSKVVFMNKNYLFLTNFFSLILFDWIRFYFIINLANPKLKTFWNYLKIIPKK